MNRLRWAVALAAVAIGVAALVLPPRSEGERPAGSLPPPRYDQAFWGHWGDGKAELAGYELTYPRYGELRRGTAVTIFVTESFANSARVKAERPDREASDLFPVLKLNLIQDFPTGLYDYNLMTSAFVALEAINGRSAGLPTKVSFSSQEWCGQVFSQLLFDEQEVRHLSHSYFDGEGDREERLPYPKDGFSEDVLLLWARGLAAPALDPGETLELRLLRSQESSRLLHLPLDWVAAGFSRSPNRRRIRVPAGEYEVEVLRVEIAPARATSSYPPTGREVTVPELTWTFFVESRPPRRLVRWTRSDGLGADLLASARLEYWAMNGNGFERALERLGLRERPSRTP